MFVSRAAAAALSIALALRAQAAPGSERDLGDKGGFHKWHKVEIILPGPDTSVTAEDNPFAVPVDVTFKGPGGTFKVPAFYDGDGKGAGRGNVWKVRFSPNETGKWTFTSASSESELDHYRGTFTVDGVPAGAPRLLKWGRLQYAGSHYLKFADGGYWIKAGLDDPENFLGRPFGDWEGKKRAIDYLNSKGCNSIYVMTNTIAPGDGNDTWPWLGDTPKQARANGSRSRYDVQKLARWEDFFSYCQNKGVVLHIVLLDDSAWHDFDHRLYYREMIARFGHHPAVIWNIGEEADEAYSSKTQLAHAAMIRELDPYDHPLTVHAWPDWPYMGNGNFDLTSIQTKPGGATDFTTARMPDINAIVIQNRKASAAKGRPLAVMIDEPPRITLVNKATRHKFRSTILYAVFLGGGGYELHYQDPGTQRGKTTLKALAPMLDDLRLAREFVESLPFDQMAPHNELLSAAGGGYCLARPGQAYGIYLKEGGSARLDLGKVSGAYQIEWYEVTTGATRQGALIKGGAERSLGKPAFSGDVACAVTRKK